MPIVRLVGQLSLWAGRLASLIVLPLVVAMVYEVVARYAFKAPTAWAFELSYMMMGTIFLLGIAYALKVNQHVNVDFIHNMLPKRAIAAIDMVGYVILTAMAAWMVTALADNAVSTYRSGEGSGLSAWNPPVWPYRVVYAVGFALFALQAFAKAIENLMVVFGRETEDAR